MASPESALRIGGSDSFVSIEKHGFSGVGKEADDLNLERSSRPPNIVDINTASKQDIKDRMIFQEVKYIMLDRMGQLTPPWRKFGRRHRAEIRKINDMLLSLEQKGKI